MRYKKEQKHNFTVLTSILISICDTLLSFWNQFHSVSTGWLKSLNPVAQSGADSTLETRMVTFHIQSSYLFSSGTAEAFLFTLQIPTILKPLQNATSSMKRKIHRGLNEEIKSTTIKKWKCNAEFYVHESWNFYALNSVREEYPAKWLLSSFL